MESLVEVKMMLRRLCTLFLAISLAAASAAEDRVALVIGNAKYDGEAALKNPANDADAMAAALAKLDFKVTKKTDVDLTQLEDAVVDFRKGLKKNSVAFFFYAGHGLQVKGENFLVPLKANVKEEFQVKEKCYKLDQVLSALDDSEAALKLVVLDCCRDNPFTRGWTRGAQNKGLASIDVPNGTIIAFSTAPGQTALDGRGQNSPYTTHLVASLGSRPKGGLEVKTAFFTASRAVFKEVGQRPWINLDGSLEDHYLWQSDGKAPVEKSFRDAVSDLRTNHRAVRLSWNHYAADGGHGSCSLFRDDDLEPTKFAEIEKEVAAGTRLLQIGMSAAQLKESGPPPVTDFLCDVWFEVDGSFTAEHVAAIARCGKINTLMLTASKKFAPSAGAMKSLGALAAVKELNLCEYGEHAELTESDLRDLARSPCLEVIAFGGRISDSATSGIASFASTPKLKQLSFSICEPTDKLKATLKLLEQRGLGPKIVMPTTTFPAAP